MRKLLLAVLLVSLAGSAFGAGTFASFTATVTNAGSTFATGSLVLSTTPSASGTGSPTATACFSTAGGVTDTNTNSACGAMLTTSVAAPSTDATNATPSAFGIVSIKNEGTIAASTFSYAVACSATANNGATTYHGTLTSTSLCNTTAVGTSPSNNLQIRIQEVTDATGATASGTTCVLPASNTQNCTTQGTWTPLGTANTNGTVALSTSNSSGATISAGSTRYFKISLLLPSTANNAVQGLSQAFGVTWSVTQ